MAGDMKALLIIPCYNEAENIGRLMTRIKALGEEYDTIIIDDGSTDETFEIGKQFSSAVRLICNLGIGGAVQTGIIYALKNNYQMCIQVDGDGQHPPDEISKLINCHLSGGANIVIGSRFVENKSFRSTWARRKGIFIIKTVINKFFNFEIKDPTSGFRLLDQKAIKLFANDYPTDFPEPISIAMALENDLKIKEIPVNMEARGGGESSIRGIKTLIYMLRVVAYIVLKRIGRFI